MKKVIYMSSLICFSMTFLKAMDKDLVTIKKNSLMASQQLGELDLVYDNSGFHVLQNGESNDIKSCNVDSLLRKANKEMLKKFQKVGYIEVKQNQGEFYLKAKVRGPGGGPLLAAVLYFGSKYCALTAIESLSEETKRNLIINALTSVHHSNSDLDLDSTIAIATSPLIMPLIEIFCIESIAAIIASIGYAMPWF